MIDRSTMVELLTVLREQRDLKGGTEETALFNELNLRAHQPLTTASLREHLQLAEDRRWVSRQRGLLDDVRWSLTPAGAGALDDLLHHK